MNELGQEGSVGIAAAGIALVGVDEVAPVDRSSAGPVPRPALICSCDCRRLARFSSFIPTLECGTTPRAPSAGLLKTGVEMCVAVGITLSPLIVPCGSTSYVHAASIAAPRGPKALGGRGGWDAEGLGAGTKG